MLKTRLARLCLYSTGSLLLVLHSGPSHSQLFTIGDVGVTGKITLESLTIQSLTVTLPPTATVALAMQAATLLLDEARNAEMHARFDRIEAKLDQVLGELRIVRTQLNAIQAALVHLSAQIDQLDVTVRTTAAKSSANRVLGTIESIRTRWPRWQKEPSASWKTEAEQLILQLETETNALMNFYYADFMNTAVTSLLIQADMWKLLGRTDLKRGVLTAHLRFLEAITSPASAVSGPRSTVAVMPEDSLPTRLEKYRKLVEATALTSKELTAGRIRRAEAGPISSRPPCDVLASAYAWAPQFSPSDFVIRVTADWPTEPSVGVCFKASPKLLNAGWGAYWGRSYQWYHPASLVAGFRWQVYSHVNLGEGGYKLVRHFLYPQDIQACNAICVACTGRVEGAASVDSEKLVRDSSGTLTIPMDWKPLIPSFLWYPPDNSPVVGSPKPSPTQINVGPERLPLLVRRCDFGVLASANNPSLGEFSQSMRVGRDELGDLIRPSEDAIARANSFLNSAMEAATANKIANMLAAQYRREIQ